MPPFKNLVILAIFVGLCLLVPISGKCSKVIIDPELRRILRGDCSAELLTTLEPSVLDGLGARVLSTVQNFSEYLPSHFQDEVDQKLLLQALIRKFIQGKFALASPEDLEPKQISAAFEQSGATAYFADMTKRLRQLLAQNITDVMVILKDFDQIKSGDPIAHLVAEGDHSEGSAAASIRFVLLLNAPAKYDAIELFISLLHELVHYLDIKTLKQHATQGGFRSNGEKTAALEARAFAYELYLENAVLRFFEEGTIPRPYTLKFLNDFFSETVGNGEYPEAYRFLRQRRTLRGGPSALFWRVWGIARIQELEREAFVQ